MTTFVIKTTSSAGILHYLPDLSVQTYMFRFRHFPSHEYGERVVYTTEVESVDTILQFSKVMGNIVIGQWMCGYEVHPEDIQIVEYLNTLPFIEIYDDYRE